MSAPAPSRPCWHLDAVGLVVIAALTAAAYMMGVRPYFAQCGKRAELETKLESARQMMEMMESSRDRLSHQLDRVQDHLAESPLRLETPDAINRRLARIVDLAADSGMVIHETRSGETTPGERFSTVPVALVGSGSYSECAAFLHHLCARIPDVGVVGFELAGTPGNPRAESTFRFDLVWHAVNAVALEPDGATAGP